MKNLTILILVVAWTPAQAAVFHVGPGMPYEKPSEVALIAEDGDTIEIEASTYMGDVAVWTQNDLVIRGIGGRPHLRAAGKSAENKAIWVIKGNNTTVENIEFSGGRVADENGAGIRLEGTHLTVRSCYFHDNENGILTGEDAESEVLVEYSEFSNNGFGDGYSHNMYIGRIARFTLRFSYSHHAKVGHQVKSRAEVNHILFNRLMDGVSGNSSYIIDLPDPGAAFIVGNEIQQGPAAENWAMLNVSQRLNLVNNTLVNDRGAGIFVRLTDESGSSILQNNIFAGRGNLGASGVSLVSNLAAESVGLASRTSFDFGLTAQSKAIDRGTAVSVMDAEVLPASEYVHPAAGKLRQLDGMIDIGAHEYQAAE